MIALHRDHGRYVLVVWGLTANGTMAACQLLQHYDDLYPELLTGKALILRWQDSNENQLVDTEDTLTVVETWINCNSDYLITSYWTVNEQFYSGGKVPVRDANGLLLGFYKDDFVADVQVEGWGRGDGLGNDGRYLGYDPSFGFMKSDSPLDAYGNPLVPWRTVAADPSIPRGTKVYIVDLGPNPNVTDEVADILLESEFLVSDRGPSIRGHHIDVYVGDQTRKEMDESPYALYIEGATVCLSGPTVNSALEGVKNWVCFIGGSGSLRNLSKFDLIVVDPDSYSADEIEWLKSKGGEVVAYVSIGTAENWRWYWSLVRDEWKIAPIENWDGEWYVNVSYSGWRALIIRDVMPRILDKGFNGFFLDNLDVAELYPSMVPEMTEFIAEIRAAYPKALLIGNNGLYIMDEVYFYLDGLTKEDVSATYDWSKAKYVKVPVEESDEMLKILSEWKRKSLTIFTLDYAVTSNLAEYCYNRSREYGLIPYAANIYLDKVFLWP